MAVDPCLVLHENDSETWGLQIAELFLLSLVDYRRFAFGASNCFVKNFPRPIFRDQIVQAFRKIR